jgi:hypothetical protein
MNCVFPSTSAQKEIKSFSRFVEPTTHAEELVELHETNELEVITIRMQKEILFNNKLQVCFMF